MPRLKLNPRKEYAVTNRIRRGYERKLEGRLQLLFRNTFRDAAKAYELGNVDSGLNGLATNLSRVLVPHYTEVVTTFAKKVLTDRGIKFDFDNLSQQFITDHGGRSIRNIDSYTRRLVQRVISRGQRDGLGESEIARSLIDMGAGFSKRRAATIARTETGNASSWANHQMHKEFMPANTKKRWVASSDDRTRSAHAVMNGVEVGIDEEFTVGGFRMLHPNDPKGGAGNVINCRCVLMYVEPDDDVEGVVTDEPVVDDQPEADFVPPDDFTPIPPQKIQFPETSRAGRKRMIELMQEGAEDARYSNINRFGGWANGRYVGKVSKLDDSLDLLLTPMVEEVTKLAVLFNVPKLRGIVSIRKKGVNMEMGDGILGINKAHMHRILQSSDVARWERGSSFATSRQDRAWAVDSYMDNRFDKIRSIFLHEFGHQVHNYYKASRAAFETASRSRKEWLPPVELKLLKLKPTRKSRQGPSVYSDTNEKEWFAENFAAWFMGKRDIVDPDFRVLIQELIDNAYD